MSSSKAMAAAAIPRRCPRVYAKTRAGESPESGAPTRARGGVNPLFTTRFAGMATGAILRGMGDDSPRRGCG